MRCNLQYVMHLHYRIPTSIDNIKPPQTIETPSIHEQGQKNTNSFIVQCTLRTSTPECCTKYIVLNFLNQRAKKAQGSSDQCAPSTWKQNENVTVSSPSWLQRPWWLCRVRSWVCSDGHCPDSTQPGADPAADQQSGSKNRWYFCEYHFSAVFSEISQGHTCFYKICVTDILGL